MRRIEKHKIMDIQSIIGGLKEKFGDSFDVSKVTAMLKDVDLSKFSMSDIVEKVKAEGLIGDLDGDGVKESLFEELKGKVGSMFGK